MTDIDVAARLRARNQRTVYGQIDTGEIRNEPPTPASEDAELWLPFVIKRVSVEDVKQDGLILAFAAHDLERYAEGRLKEAQDAREQFESKRPPNRRGKSQYTPPELPAEQLSERYLARRGEVLALLTAGMVAPAYAEVAGSLGPLEAPLVQAIINFGAGERDPKAPSAS